MNGYNRGALEDLRVWATHPDNSMSGYVFDMRWWFNRLDGDRVCMCLGGRAVQRAGATFVWSVHPVTGEPHVFECRMPDGRQLSVSRAACQVLGISEDEADVLFDMDEQFTADTVLGFLDVLCVRAHTGLPNMTNADIFDWCESQEI